ncbi:hypothetical protein [Robiginitalea sediminis]|uniref:hypothetical protein n=1 Tax=Robiginitalea sediminis TaxID=1982593 RepID=UPI000B4A8BB9|nr:hypothetical protein [Robiginitalea sediminis]
MKQLILLVTALLLGTGSSLRAASVDKVAMPDAFRYGNSFIFVENGITFSVYPDGEFDFHIDRYAGISAHIGAGPVGVTFNTGFDYNPYVQYDDYGAVIQVEHTPVFYDFYGRVNRIGDIRIWYRNGLAYRIGGMRIFYNPGGYYDYHTGFINVYNRVYVYRPFHRLFIRPALGFCMVYNRPYRRFYQPLRYTYYRPYRFNARRHYVAVGKTHRYRERADRSRVYRNDNRVSARRFDDVRSERTVYRNDAVRSNARSNQGQHSVARSEQVRQPERRVTRTTPARQEVRSTRKVDSREPRARQSNRSDSRVTRSTTVTRKPQVRKENRGDTRVTRTTTTTRRTSTVTRSPQRKDTPSQVRKPGRSADSRARSKATGSRTSEASRSRSRSNRSGH